MLLKRFNMNFTKFFKIVSIALLSITIVASILYLYYASDKNCLTCTLPVCEKIDANGNSYFAPAEDCAMTYAHMQKEFGSNNTECCKECIEYAGNFTMFAIIMGIIACILIISATAYMLYIKPTKLLQVLWGFVALIIIVGISYAVSSDTIPRIIGFKDTISKFEVQIADTLLYTSYTLLALAGIGIIVTNFIKLFRK